MYLVTVNKYLDDSGEFLTELVGVFDTELHAEIVEKDLIDNWNNNVYDEISVTPIEINKRYL